MLRLSDVNLLLLDLLTSGPVRLDHLKLRLLPWLRLLVHLCFTAPLLAPLLPPAGPRRPLRSHQVSLVSVLLLLLL